MHELDDIGPDEDTIALFEPRLIDALSIDEGPVGAAKIFNGQLTII